MDDPWGSPWANNDTTSNPPAPLSTLGIGPPPKVLLSPNLSAASNSRPESSPWTPNDDGFGDWTSGGTDATTAPSGTLNPWASWGGDASPRNRSPRRESSRKDSNAARSRAVSAASSPSLRPLPLARTPTLPSPALSRQPSFDPWKSDVSLKTSVDDTEVAGDSSKDILHITEAAFETPRRLRRTETEESGWSSMREPPKLSRTGTEESGWALAQPPKGITRQDTEESGWGSIQPPKLRPSSRPRETKALEEKHEPSQPSSRSSGSAHDNESRESPITSVDEEAQDKERKVSKVQGLVDMYDGLGKRKPSDESAKSAQPEDDESKAEGTKPGGNNADFDDFEEATDDEDATTTPTKSPFTPRQGWADEDWKGPSASPTISPPREPELPPPDVHIPLDKLDELFPPPEDEEDTPQTKGHKREESFSHTIYDTFSDTSERKAWYRISRFGSMLRNNAADFENYTSASWPQTTVHDDTMKTVRRWITGEGVGAAAGGNTSSNSGVFGWDSATPSVSMEEIFGRKRAVTHQPGHMRQVSTVLSPTVSNTLSPASPNTASFRWSSAQPEAPPQPPKSRPISLHQPLHQKQASNPWNSISPPVTARGPPDASFGWGSFDVSEKNKVESPISMTALEPSHTGPSLLSGESPSIPPPLIVSPPSAQPHIPSPLSIPPRPIMSPPVSTNTFEDDEEWGEMVSSPTKEASNPLEPSATPDAALPYDEEIRDIISQLPDLSWMLL